MSNAKPTVTFQDVIEFLYSKATKEERQSVSRTLSILRDDDIQSAKMEFKVGDKVKFEPRKRNFPRVVYGVVTQKNIKTIHVRPEHGGREWKVTASLLERDDRPAK